MDLVVEDGTGLPTANSYCTVEEAADILSINVYSTWATLAATEGAQDAFLMWATRILDERVKWFGTKVYGTSGTAWPRYRAYDKEGFAIDDNVVPKQVKLATAILANFLVVNAGDPEAVNTSNNLTELKVDVILLKFDPTILPNKYPTEISFILSGLGTVSMGRGGPKYIIRY